MESVNLYYNDLIYSKCGGHKITSPSIVNSQSQSPPRANGAQGGTYLHIRSPRPHICECSEGYRRGLVHW